MIDLRPRAWAPIDLDPSPTEPRPVSSRAADGTGRAIAWTGLVVGLLTIAVTLMPDGPALLRAPVALAFACLAPGAALLAHRRWSEPAVAWALVVLVSLAGFAAATTALAWAGWWQPRPVALAGALAVVASCLAALARSVPGPSLRRSWRRPGPATVGHLAVLATGAGLWLAAVAGTDVARVGELGLLATVHPAFFAALLLCAAGFVAALRRPGGGRGLLLGGYLVLLVLILHGTTPLLLDNPEYAWTYKHLGVAELLRDQGGLTDSGDIYQQWPSLFAAVAGLSDLAGVTPLGLARWAPVFFSLAGALVVLAIGRTLSRNRRVAYLAAFLFLCLNWIEEDYLSPQAFAYLLGLGVLLVALRWLRRPPEVRHGRPGWLARLHAGSLRAPAVPPPVRMVALAVVVGLFAVLTASHQLSPYLLVGQLAVLVALRLIRPWWLVPVLAGIAVAYLLPRFGMVSGSFHVFESLDFFGNAAGNAESWGSTGQAFSAVVVRTLALAVWTVAGFAVWRSRHRLGAVLVPAVLAGTPFVLLAAQSYGGEAIYRVFLFSVPWCAYLIADLVVRAKLPTGQIRQALVWAVAVLALAGGALATVQGRHGQLMVDEQTTSELAAARYLYGNATPGATIALATPDFPSRLAGNYDQFNRSVPVGEPDLVKGAELRDAQLDRRYVPGIEDYLRSFHGTTSYLVVSDGMRAQAEYFGYLPDGSLDALEEALAAAPGWSVFYRNDEVAIYQYQG
jgi:hypothetical protein